MKLRERVVICFGITFVLFTLILVIDFQYEIGYGGHRFFMPMRHGRVQMVEDTGLGAGAGAGGAGAGLPERSVYKSFQNKFAPGAAPGAGSEVYEESLAAAADSAALSGNLSDAHDSFKDLQPYTGSYDDLDTDDAGRKVVIVVFEYREEQPSLSEYINFDAGANETLQITFHKRISKREMYKENDALVEAILKQLQTRKIVHVREKEGGTQLKLIIHYDNGEFALFKPMRFPREQQTLPNHFYFTDYERHNAEIAAFHLDRLLGFRRSMPVTGRQLNLTSEFYKIADAELLKTFFVSPANNLCFHGHCSYYCDTSHAICGNPDKVEGSFAAFLPEKQVADRTLRKHPWRRSYHKRRKALWETEPNYCDAVKRTPPYNRGILLLDLVDTSIFDFLMGNMDRHHFETFTAFGNDTFPLHLDHGRGFGKAFHDELSILAPLTQCCIVKQSTLKMLLGFHNGAKKLSHHMRESLEYDPLNPILWEPHFAALDRRVKIVLEALRECIRQARESGSDALSASIDATPSQ
ncbi:extracellular serine/threonine protein CG31145 [Planococcus citri]|uniref:extracellular serine/threonine protein CG31145 n=1 Tax=Planococcus citri TaxID=170843 RepID=UPI0031F80A12